MQHDIRRIMMIFDELKNYQCYEALGEKVRKGLQFLKDTDFSKFEKGVHEIDGKDMYFVMAEYETKDLEQGLWESHKKYIDVHYILEGKEKFLYADFDSMKIKKDYDEQGDCFMLEGNSQGEVIAEPGKFVWFLPQDVHMPGIKVDEKEKLRKVILKISM